MADLTAELAPDYLAWGLELSAEDFPAVTVSADPSQLRRVVTNIWDNSAKYKVRDVGRGFISLDAGGVLTLSDDGPGVPMDGFSVCRRLREATDIPILMVTARREDLYEKVWGLEAVGDNATAAVHINRLREKLEQNPSHPRYIQTVWGAGYRFRAQERRGGD